jgi:PUA-domain protein
MKKLLRKKEIKELNNLLKEEVLKNSKIELLKDNQEEFIFIDEIPALFMFNNNWVFTLNSINNEFNSFSYAIIKVDKGAIRFIANGADIMRPGIVEISENIKKDDLVIIVEEVHNKALAIGKALFSGEEISSMNSGKVIKTIHYVGDIIWNKKIN